MSPRRALFRCNGCEMQIHLIAPVERPCPACGGEFEEIDEEEEYTPLDLGFGSFRKPTIMPMTDDDIELTVQEAMPEIMAGLEELLSQH